MLKTMDHHKAIELLREVVAEVGADHVYNAPIVRDSGAFGMCRYVHHDGNYTDSIEGDATPGCIVGQALHRYGVSLEFLNQVEGLGADQIAIKEHLNRKHIPAHIDPPITEKAGQVLRAAQWEQDNGLPWGVALAKAEAEYTHLTVEGALSA